MKQKIIALIALLVLIAGCTLTASSPKKAVEDLFSKFQTLNDKVIDQLNDVIDDENLTATQKTDYENLMRKQYQNLTYKIKEETINGDTAIITVEIEVFDFAKVNDETKTYVNDHPKEFLDNNGKYSNSLYQDYKIKQLKNVTDRIKYTLDLGLTKTDEGWTLDELSDAERQKIHGLYNV